MAEDDFFKSLHDEFSSPKATSGRPGRIVDLREESVPDWAPAEEKEEQRSVPSPPAPLVFDPDAKVPDLLILIAQPTIDLIEKTLADEIEVRSPQVDCKAIHSRRSDNVLRDVKYRLMKKEDDPGPQGQITLITHAEHIKIQGP
jgi:hypothetical protein